MRSVQGGGWQGLGDKVGAGGKGGRSGPGRLSEELELI